MLLRTPPETRTRNHSLRRGPRFSSYASGVWSGTQESNLAIPLYQSGPVDQLGRARQRKVEVSIFRG